MISILRQTIKRVFGFVVVMGMSTQALAHVGDHGHEMVLWSHQLQHLVPGNVAILALVIGLCGVALYLGRQR